MIRWFKSHPPNPRGAPRGKGNGQWKGGRSFTHKGYVYIRVPKDYPGARSHGYILEHRFIMQEAIGRPLTSREVVHHKNGDRGDNRLENLELCVNSQPPSQRVEDQIAWAKEILARYGEDS